MCAYARKPGKLSCALPAQRHPACSDRDDIRCRGRGIIRGSGRLNASLQCVSTNTCGVPSLNLYRVSTQGRRQFAVSVACYCYVFLIYSVHAVLSQSLEQQQPLQIDSATAHDFFIHNSQPDQQRLSTLFSGAKPLPLFERAAAATVPVLPAVTGGEEVAREATAKNEVLLPPAEATTHFNGAVGERPSSAGTTGERIGSNLSDRIVEKQLLEETFLVPQQQRRQGSRHDVEEERQKVKEGQKIGGWLSFHAVPMTKLQRVRAEDNSHKHKQSLTHALESSRALIWTKPFFGEEFKYSKNYLQHGEGTDKLEHPVEVEESNPYKQGGTASHSPIKNFTTSVTSAAYQSASDPVNKFPVIAPVDLKVLHLVGADRRWECRAGADGLGEADREDRPIANCPGPGVSTGRMHVGSDADLVGISAAQKTSVPDRTGGNVNALSSGVFSNAAYTLRRRLAAVSEPSTTYVTGQPLYQPRHSNPRGSGTQAEQMTVMEHERQAADATGILTTHGENLQADDWSADSALVDVSAQERTLRRRRRVARNSFDPRWKNSEFLSGGKAASAVGTAKLFGTLPQLDEEYTRQQRSIDSRLPGSSVYGTPSSDMKGREGISSNAGGGNRFDDINDHSLLDGSGAMRSTRVRGPQGNRFSRLLGEIETTKGVYGTTTIETPTPSVSSSQQPTGWSVPSSADSLERIPIAKPSWISEESDDHYVTSVNKDGLPVSRGKRLKNHAQRLSALNEVMELAAVAKAESLNNKGEGRMPGATTQLNTPVQSVIDLGVTSPGSAGTSLNRVDPIYQPGQPQWQQQLAEGNQIQSLVPTTDLQQDHLSPAMQPAQKAEEATEETGETERVLFLRYLDKPLRKRQRAAIFLEALITVLSVWMLSRLTVSVMKSTTRRNSVPLLLGKALAVMWLGRRILANLNFVASALQVLIQDMFLRQKRQQLLEVADALRTLQEEERRAQSYM